MPDSDTHVTADERSRRVLDMIADLDVLPTTATIPLRLLKLQRDSRAGITDFADVLAADPSLCTKVLGLVNSAWFSPVRPITKVSDAVSMIGIRHLMPLAFASAIAGVYDKMGLPAGPRQRLWEASLVKGVGAQVCARHCGSQLAEEAFISGLVQDMALPVLYCVDQPAWSQVEDILEGPDQQRSQKEEILFGLDHARFGGRLATRLGLPELYKQMAEHHHDTDRLAEIAGDHGLETGLRFAAKLPHLSGGQGGVQRLVAFLSLDDITATLAVPPSQLLADVEQEVVRMLHIMGDDASAEHLLQDFIRETSQVLTRQLESMIGESSMLMATFETVESDLKRKIEELEQRASESDYDVLTHALNRRGFAARASDIFAHGQALGYGCGIAFADLDNFKIINDRHGHDVGDAVLRTVSVKLKDVLKGVGLVGRFGGDEFVFLIVADDKDQALEITKRAARSLHGATVTVGDKTIRVKTSIGLLWLGVPDQEQRLEDVLRQADRFMYQAKRSGGARIIVGEARGTS